MAQKAPQSQVLQTVNRVSALEAGNLDKTGTIAASQIDKNRGLIDLTMLAPDVISAITGEADVNAVLADGGVVYTNMGFPAVYGVESKNLFNKDTVIPNSYIDENGVQQPFSGWWASYWIRVRPNTTYHKNTDNSVAFYDSTRTFIAPVTVAGVNTFITPNDCYWLRLSFAPGVNLETAQVELGSSETTFESFYPKVNPDSIPSASITQEKIGFKAVVGAGNKNLFDKSKVIPTPILVRTVICFLDPNPLAGMPQIGYQYSQTIRIIKTHITRPRTMLKSA